MDYERTPLQRALGLASRQDSLLTRSQLQGFGLTDDQIDWQLGRWLSRVASTVYVTAGARWTWRQAARAACLAGPPGTVASHLTAAALASLCPPPVLPHVIVPRGRSGRLRIAKVHYGRVDPQDRTTVDGIPCTKVARTLVDCASVLDRDGLANLVDVALCEGKASVASVEAVLARTGTIGRAGPALLRTALADWTGPIRADSPAEMRLLRLVAEWGFPTPDRQVAIRDTSGNLVALADLGWAQRTIGIDYDSIRWHGPRRWFHDETRHAAIEACGWHLLHADKVDLLPGERALRASLDRAWDTRAA